MRSNTTFSLLLLVALVGLAPRAFSQAAPNPGNCTSGNAEADLDVNNVLARAFNTGSLFFGNATTNGDGYLVPQASGNSPVYATGIWIGGEVNGDLRIAGATYRDFEFWPGPLNDDGTLPSPTCDEIDGVQFNKIWKVSESDIANFEAGAGTASDLGSWPVAFGAPALAAPDNNFDDDGDGDTDEGTDGVDNDEDGNIDERDEQERIDPDVRLAAGRPVYDLAAGDRPELIGNQALWWVMNDLGNTHGFSGRPPIGVEVQVLMWSFARADALNDVTFYRYRVTKKTPGVMENTFFSIFSDPDLGDASDDLVGVDTTLSLGYVYNALGPEGTGLDANYGIPPAAGYDFFQGPIVDLDGDGERTDTLGVTRFMYFTNEDPPTGDPDTGVGMYNFMQGLWGDGTPLTASGDGFQTDGPVTLFAFPGDPVAGTFWSEENPLDEGRVETNGADRRFLVTTGPFNLIPGVSQDVVFGIVFAQGSDRLQSITALRQADRLAQTAYDIDFELPSAPPAPPLCDRNSPNPELLPGSGNCLEAIEVDGDAALVWGYPTNSPNYLGTYETIDFLLGGQGVSDSTYNFEGFNVYRYPNSNFDDSQRERVATYDVINGITTVIDTEFDPAVEQAVPYVAANGSNTGVQYFYEPSSLTNYTDYYFGVSAYAVNLESVPKVIESAARKITFRPSSVAAGNGGSIQGADLGDALVAEQTNGIGRAQVIAQVVDPTKITGARYTVEIFEFFQTEEDEEDENPTTTFRVVRGDGEVLFDGEQTFRELGVLNEIFPEDEEEEVAAPVNQSVVVDGLSFILIEDPAGVRAADLGGDVRIAGLAGQGVVEVATPGTDPCEDVPSDSGAEGYDAGCEFYDGNTVFADPDIQNEYAVTVSGDDLFSASADDLLLPGVIGGDDYEMRFTEACATPGSCLGAYVRDDEIITSVPFELWNLGDIRNPDDDVRMIPLIRDQDGQVENWADTFTEEVLYSPAPGDTVAVGITEEVFFAQPDRPDGYALFEAAARDFGGPGATYDPENDGDTQIDLRDDGEECSRQGWYIDFCFRATPPFRFPIQDLVIADLAGDGTTPEAGTTIRILTAPKPVISVGDTYVFNTEDLRFITGDAETAEEALDRIGIVPNPYLGVSAYESNNLDRVARFINLPDVATIRIYTVAGTLIRTLRKDGPSRSLDWNLTTHNNLPVASGMYYIHIDVPGVGEKVLKFGVVNRKNRITIF